MEGMPKIFKTFLFWIFIFCEFVFPQSQKYSWLEPIDYNSRVNNILLPPGFARIAYRPATFQDWLQHLPLKDSTALVKLYNGSLKSNQTAHFRIIHIDVGKNDLQQCADAIIRLYAEYQYAQKKYTEIAFNFTSGDRAEFSNWAAGYRPRIKGNQVKWKKTAGMDSSYTNFRAYLNTIFMYAGSYSLSKELKSVKNLNNLEVGDVFIQPGFPGHAVIVIDLAINPASKENFFLLAQSYMPAQEVHILKNPANRRISPWYKLKEGEHLETPEWTFEWTDLKRFK
jgi:hypothetical protein